MCAIGALVSADSVWINALGVAPNRFGYEEMKTAASPRPVDMMNTLPGNDADGLRLSRKRTIYMLKIGAKVSNRSVGRKYANFRGFCQIADNQYFAKNKGSLALFCVHFSLE